MASALMTLRRSGSLLLWVNYRGDIPSCHYLKPTSIFSLCLLLPPQMIFLVQTYWCAQLSPLHFAYPNNCTNSIHFALLLRLCRICHDDYLLLKSQEIEFFRLRHFPHPYFNAGFKLIFQFTRQVVLSRKSYHNLKRHKLIRTFHPHSHDIENIFLKHFHIQVEPHVLYLKMPHKMFSVETVISTMFGFFLNFIAVF